MMVVWVVGQVVGGDLGWWWIEVVVVVVVVEEEEVVVGGCGGCVCRRWCVWGGVLTSRIEVASVSASKLSTSA